MKNQSFIQVKKLGGVAPGGRISNFGDNFQNTCRIVVKFCTRATETLGIRINFIKGVYLNLGG